MLIVDGIRTLANVFIVDPTHANFVSQTTYSQGVDATITTQTKIVSHCDQHHEDDFIFLVVEIFGCLHQHAYDFF